MSRSKHQLTPGLVAVDDVAMGTEATAQQLGQLLETVGQLRTDVAVILERTADIKDHEQRLRSLESVRSKLGAYWAAAAVFGAVAGWLAAFLTVRHG